MQMRPSTSVSMHAGHRSLYYVYKMFLSILVTLLRPRPAGRPMIDTRIRLIAVAGSLRPAVGDRRARRRRRSSRRSTRVLWVADGARAARPRRVARPARLDHRRDRRRRARARRCSSSRCCSCSSCCLHFSVRVSALERRLTALVQEIGLLGRRPATSRARREAEDRRGAAHRRDHPVLQRRSAGRRAGAGVDPRGRSRSRSWSSTTGRGIPDTLERSTSSERGGVTVVRRRPTAASARRGRRAAAHSSAPFVFPLDATTSSSPGALAAMATCSRRTPDARSRGATTCSFGEQTRPLPLARALASRGRSTYVNPYPSLLAVPPPRWRCATLKPP